MSARAREIELLALTIFAAIPLYGTQTISAPPLIAFHLTMAAIVARVLTGRSAQLIPSPIMRFLGVAYVFFYVIDAALISRSAISASTHLVLFIAAYQAMEGGQQRNEGQRLLTASLIFIASVATATHIAILPFVVIFGFLLFRQLIHLSHRDSIDLVTARSLEPPSNRAAAFYVCGTTLIGMVLFPVLPRVRNPLVPGMVGSLTSASTGLSDSINLNEQRTITPDATVVSRVWMGQEAIPFFTPLRLRGMIYERFVDGKWLQGPRGITPVQMRNGVARIARASGFNRRASVQQRFIVGTRLFLPAGTFEVIGVPQIYEYPRRDIYTAWQSRGDLINYDVGLAWNTIPLRAQRVAITNYPVTAPVLAMARRLAGNQTDPMKQAVRIESYLSTHFQYIADPAKIGHRMSVDEFLLRDHRGHCEYFAAGMVALMTALDVPARIVGGFYGGKLNPLTGYFVVRREDAHAWVEVFDGSGWRTFDPTPADLRPGNAQSGLLRAYASALNDSVNYFWDRYILTFGLGDQMALAEAVYLQARKALGEMQFSPRQAAKKIFSTRYLLIVAGFVALAMIVYFIAQHRRPAFELLRDHLRARGINVGPAMTMEEALVELHRSQPEIAAALAPLIALYEEEQFSAHGRPAREHIRRRLAELTVNR
ncbi:MAG TPA: transglutaminaseTgpA domain-containing protein [Thermoanaerobaculia bacterium]